MDDSTINIDIIIACISTAYGSVLVYFRHVKTRATTHSRPTEYSEYCLEYFLSILAIPASAAFEVTRCLLLHQLCLNYFYHLLLLSRQGRRQV